MRIVLKQECRSTNLNQAVKAKRPNLQICLNLLETAK